MQQWLPVDPEEAFAFFADPHNLPRIMPAWLDARLERLQLVRSEEWSKVGAGVGSRIEISFRALPLLPFRVRWMAEITEFVPNEYFCDVQARGPLLRWRHCHRVTPAGHGCVLGDEIEYDLGLGGFGGLVNAVVVRPALRVMFHGRQQKTLQLLERAVRPGDSRRDGGAPNGRGPE